MWQAFADIVEHPKINVGLGLSQTNARNGSDSRLQKFMLWLMAAYD